MRGWVSVRTLAYLPCVGFGRTHHDLTVLHTFESDQATAQFLHTLELAFDHHHFETHIVVEMRMHCLDDELVVFMLRLG